MVDIFFKRTFVTSCRYGNDVIFMNQIGQTNYEIGVMFKSLLSTAQYDAVSILNVSAHRPTTHTR